PFYYDLPTRLLPLKELRVRLESNHVIALLARNKRLQLLFPPSDRRTVVVPPMQRQFEVRALCRQGSDISQVDVQSAVSTRLVPELEHSNPWTQSRSHLILDCASLALHRPHLTIVHHERRYDCD